jgi:Fur family zinc uptake transcriptional regulator
VYRALDFLIEQGLAHKIGRSNCFIACRHASHQLPALFLVCPQCSHVAEVQDKSLSQALMRTLDKAGYQLDAPEMEISAVCPQCGKS